MFALMKENLLNNIVYILVF